MSSTENTTHATTLSQIISAHLASSSQAVIDFIDGHISDQREHILGAVDVLVPIWEAQQRAALEEALSRIPSFEKVLADAGLAIVSVSPELPVLDPQQHQAEPQEGEKAEEHRDEQSHHTQFQTF